MTGDELILSHLWVVKSIASSLKLTLLFSADWDELVAAGNLGLVKAARMFEGRNGCQFKTYAYKCIRGEMLKSFTRLDGHHNSALVEFEPLSEVPIGPNQEQAIYESEKRRHLSIMMEHLKPRHRTVIEAYISGLPLTRLARGWGFKRHRVVKWQRTAIKNLCAAGAELR